MGFYLLLSTIGEGGRLQPVPFLPSGRLDRHNRHGTVDVARVQLAMHAFSADLTTVQYTLPCNTSPKNMNFSTPTKSVHTLATFVPYSTSRECLSTPGAMQGVRRAVSCAEASRHFGTHGEGGCPGPSHVLSCREDLNSISRRIIDAFPPHVMISESRCIKTSQASSTRTSRHVDGHRSTMPR